MSLTVSPGTEKEQVESALELIEAQTESAPPETDIKPKEPRLGSDSW
jgi:hypothetical protein